MSKSKFLAPRGTSDILPSQAIVWQELESKARELFCLYNYREIRTPIFEEIELFARSMGQASDIVEKQMLTLEKNKREGEDGIGKKSYALRPEGTASVVRAYIENNLDKKESLSKLFYIGPMFRGERPQKGRLRQFSQIGAEAIGVQSATPFLDAEMIALSVNLLKAFGIEDYTLKLNSLGTPKDKEKFASSLRAKLGVKKESLCQTCQKRFEKNIFRVLDCKNKNCQEIVSALKISNDYLSKESQEYFNLVIGSLDKMSIQYQKMPTLVRGLDYYTQTVFEITSKSLGSQDALGAGGRYNNLVQDLGGSGDVEAIGFSLGVERILLALDDQEISNKPLDIYAVAFDNKAFEKAFEVLGVLRAQGICCDINYRAGSVKSQMRAADKSGTRYVMILGEDEMKKSIATLKDMQSGTQEEVALNNVADWIKAKSC
ncbi:MAG: histidine--tRNA ligase [Candidatus Aceula meridiana]|nr:histidine--tRNA ligase [Candidatus Aceula meridiana]